MFQNINSSLVFFEGLKFLVVLEEGLPLGVLNMVSGFGHTSGATLVIVVWKGLEDHVTSTKFRVF